MAIRRKRTADPLGAYADLSPLYLAVYGKDNPMAKLHRKRKPATTNDQDKAFTAWHSNLGRLSAALRERGVSMDELHAAHGHEDKLELGPW